MPGWTRPLWAARPCHFGSSRVGVPEPAGLETKGRRRGAAFRNRAHLVRALRYGIVGTGSTNPNYRPVHAHRAGVARVQRVIRHRGTDYTPASPACVITVGIGIAPPAFLEHMHKLLPPFCLANAPPADLQGFTPSYHILEMVRLFIIWVLFTVHCVPGPPRYLRQGCQVSHLFAHAFWQGCNPGAHLSDPAADPRWLKPQRRLPLLAGAARAHWELSNPEKG